ncbi:ATP-grasp domain-containing protein [Myxococcus sp. CA051A]|uniref:ATP-grasp domain-containing protein n=1 Tax=Myxococcus sp. CA051A TaxID=2741739 RepID=UPI00157AC8CC|nr:ATP-grasp domain-containing protein [Myxococcus sp. CA051A]NTX64280.1 ATP-grasp domain-containing protein [Myxococcus sp. CA051A]
MALMTTTSSGAFVQLGATRDGLEPYLDAARRRGLQTILVETPAYLSWRQHLGRRPFDLELPVEHPSQPAEVQHFLESLGVPVTLLLAGFERYVECAFALAPVMEHGPRQRWPHGAFNPLDKWGQREALAHACPRVLQPRHVSFELGSPGASAMLTRVGFPLVVKPSNGSGGLGVFLVEDARQRDQALAALGELSNYDGGRFERVLLEEFIEGREHSIQGLAHEGRALLLTTCEKLVTREPAPGTPELRGFREAGHIATHGDRAEPALRALAQACLDATGYREGPFHVDLLRNQGGAFFVEMGFRLSGGGLSGLVDRATGMKWAELVFETHLGERVPALPPFREGPGAYVGQVTCASEDELRAGETLRAKGVTVEVQRFAATPPGVETVASPRREALAADKLRDSGFAGRLVVSGTTLEEVRHSLQSCISARLGV